MFNTKSDLCSPDQLAGKRVGVRSYTYTPGVWIRGILSDTYGVDAGQITWVLFGDEHVAEYEAPSNVISAPRGSDLQTALENQEIDAAIGLRNVESPNIQPLIPDALAVAQDLYVKAGIYPISHTVVIKNDLLAQQASLTEELCQLFNDSKDKYLRENGARDESLKSLKEVVGADPLPYGVEANRKTLEAFMRYNVEQKIIPASFELEEIFTPQC